MGLFRKEEHKKVVRDEHGNFVRFETTGDRIGSRTPVSDALLKQQKKTPSKWKSRVKKVDGAIVSYNRRNYQRGGGGFFSPMESFLGGNSLGGSSRSSKHSSSGKKKYVIRGGKAYPIAKGGKKKKRSGGRRNDFDDLFNLRI